MSLRSAQQRLELEKQQTSKTVYVWETTQFNKKALT